MSILENFKQKLQERSEKEIENTSYTHGFEKIYAIQTLDTSTIRPLNSSSHIPLEPSPEQELADLASKSSLGQPLPSTSAAKPLKKTFDESKVSKPIVEEDLFQKPESLKQMELDFGPSYRYWLSASVLQQPLQALELSPMALRFLENQGVKVVGELIGPQGQDAPELKKLGQGHLDEVRQKIKALTHGKELTYSLQIEPIAFISQLFNQVNPLGAYLLLQPFQLEHLIQLNKEQQVQVKHLFEEQKAKAKDEALKQLCQSQKKEWVKAKLQEIFNALIIPWMQNKASFCREEVIKQRWENVSVSRSLGAKLWTFLDEIYFADQKWLEVYLIKAPDAKNIFACSKEALRHYKQIIKVALSYFPTGNEQYGYQDLCFYLQKESALFWKDFSFPKIESALRLCDLFYLFRDHKAQLLVRLSGTF